MFLSKLPSKGLRKILKDCRTRDYGITTHDRYHAQANSGFLIISLLYVHNGTYNTILELLFIIKKNTDYWLSKRVTIHRAFHTLIHWHSCRIYCNFEDRRKDCFLDTWKVHSLSWKNSYTYWIGIASTSTNNNFVYFWYQRLLAISADVVVPRFSILSLNLLGVFLFKNAPLAIFLSKNKNFAILLKSHLIFSQRCVASLIEPKWIVRKVRAAVDEILQNSQFVEVRSGFI